MKKNTILSILLIVIILILIGIRSQRQQDILATDFQSCLDLGGEIQESFPRRCVLNDMSWEEELRSNEPFIDLSLPESEEKQIETWIQTNNLNTYGDAIDTVYMGGSPLFDEQTGETLSRYQYLLNNYPAKPWLESTDGIEENSPTSDLNPTDSQEPLLFTDVEEWLILEHPNFTLDYPAFTTMSESTSFPIRISSDKDFSFSIHAPQEPSGEGECVQSIPLGIDGYVYLCHNQNQQYISIYQRMIDSIIPR